MPEDDLFSFAQPESPKPASSVPMAEALKPRLAKLAEQGIYVGTSSWKYPGWCGQIYDEQRYLTRGKFSEAKFNRACLSEYGQTFKSVCVDAGYYQFPTEKYLAELCADVPDGFRFGFKVTDDITIKKFPGHARFGIKAGTFNENFLNPRLFQDRFLAPCAPFRDKIGPLIFEFSQFHKHEFEHGSEFVAALDSFFAQLPKGWQYAVEIRNKKWLVPEYFAALRSHGVAHVYNNWTRMPSVGEQMEMEGSETADFSVARFLLKPGRTYEDAVKQFQPYSDTQEINTEARIAAHGLIVRCVKKGRKLYIYINNRLEGSAPKFIVIVIDLDDPAPSAAPPLRANPL